MNSNLFHLNPSNTRHDDALDGNQEDFKFQIHALRSVIADRLLPHVGPLAWVLVDEAFQPLISRATRDRLTSLHIVAILRQLHASLPTSIDRDGLINQLRQDILSSVI